MAAEGSLQTAGRLVEQASDASSTDPEEPGVHAPAGAEETGATRLGLRRLGRHFRVKYLKYVLHAAVLIGLTAAGVKYINGDAFWRSVHHFEWSYAPVILLLTVTYMLVKGWRFVVQLRELTNTRRRLILKAYLAGQACTLLPGGAAVRAGLLDQVGVPVADSAASIALASLSDQAVLILCSLVSALWFEAARPPALTILTVLVVLSVLLGVEATRTWLLGVVEFLLGKVRLLGLWRGFLDSLKEVSTFPMLLGAVGNAALAFGLMVIALHFAAQGVGAEIPYPTLLLAFTLPTMLGRISAMPGGVGVTEAGMIGILDSAPNVTLDQAAAAAIIFRVGTVLFAALVGGLVYFVAWRGSREVARSSA
jgi:uncharacterized protein (TIRG00374 family)